MFGVNTYIYSIYIYIRVKVIPQQADVAQVVPIRLRPRIFLTFGTTRVVGRQPYEPADFTPGEIPGTHFQRLSWEPRKKFPVTQPGIDPGTLTTTLPQAHIYIYINIYIYTFFVLFNKIK